ncbi:MAG: extracellular solute-binding protein [Treponema sp.]|jgi:ABC-type glycerol-3-phosphate transport system substrate-binding protein|nr:extracellular solute-binding protein [Treponema sp.]
MNSKFSTWLDAVRTAFGTGRGLDRLLCAAALVVAALMTARLILHKAAEPEKTSLVFAVEEEEDGVLSSLAAEFEKLNPEIRLRLEKKSRGELGALVLDAPEMSGAAGKAGPAGGADLVVLDDWLLRDGISGGGLAPLSPYSGAEDHWAVPLVSLMDVLFYNIDILKAASLDRPPGNRAEFLAAARAATGNGIYGAALSLSPGDPRSVFRDVFSWMWAAGGGPLTPDFPGRAAAGTLDFLGQLAREGCLAPESGTERLEEFAGGKIAMMTGSVKDIAFLEGKVNFGITAIPPPAGYTGKPVFALYGLYAGITAGCAHPGEAWSFLSFLAERMPSAGLIRPIGESGTETDTGPLAVKARDMYEAAEIIYGYTRLERGAELEDAVRREIIPLLEGKRNGAATAEAIADQWKRE